LATVKRKRQPVPHGTGEPAPAAGNGQAQPGSDVVAGNGQPRRRATAEAMAAKQRDISVSEFFAKNRHLLGFDNPRKALLTTVKEAVDNSLDACEEAGIVPRSGCTSSRRSRSVSGGRTGQRSRGS
jgi:DNA topoisomerase VI subunit B